MIDLALKMMLDQKARFAATVLGVGFAAGLVLVQVGLFFGLLENASITIDKLVQTSGSPRGTPPTSISAIRSQRDTCSGCDRYRGWRERTT